MVARYIAKKDQSNKYKKIKSKIWYNTNDIVKTYNSMTYVSGRVDSVVKINGFRIDLKGIEKIILNLKKISNCYVFVSNNKIVAALETSLETLNF